MARRRKTASPARRVIRSAWPVLLWLIFVWWYSNTSGPLSEQEIDYYMAVMEERGTDPERRELLRAFMQNDTGDDFVMLNLIEMNSSIPNLRGLAPGSSAQDALDGYMSHMWPALLLRGCHPVSYGSSASNTIESWGIDDAQVWSQGALMRYRSRRDLLEISTNPDFQGPHDYKIAAMNKTIAIPLDPWMNSGDPRLLLGLLALIATLIGSRR